MTTIENALTRIAAAKEAGEAARNVDAGVATSTPAKPRDVDTMSVHSGMRVHNTQSVQSTQMYTGVGFARQRPQDTLRVKFTNNPAQRVRHFRRQGWQDVHILPLDRGCSKLEAVHAALEHDVWNEEEHAALIAFAAQHEACTPEG